jgi:hypothetical protein
MKPQRYVLIAGQGRSGTNWLLDILNQSRQTHCRNEPNACAGSALNELPKGEVPRPELESTLASMWDGAIARTSRSFGERDHLIRAYKEHFSRPLQRLGMVRLVTGRRFRSVVGRVVPAYRKGEWPVPRWLGSRRRNERMVPVFKLELAPGWIIWALRNRPEAQVLHLLRHPGGFLHSYMKRFFQGDRDCYGDKVHPGGLLDTHIRPWVDGRMRQTVARFIPAWAPRADPRQRRFTADLEEVGRVNRDLLARVAAHNPAWVGRVGDPRSASLLEAELLYWRYCAEAIHQAGQGNPGYRLVIYEDLARDPVDVGRSIYRGCGLEWDARTEDAVRALSSGSQAFASEWREKLTAEQKAMVESILKDSSMRSYWS